MVLGFIGMHRTFSIVIRRKRQLFALIVCANHLQIIKTVIAKANLLFSAISQTLQYVTRCGLRC